MKEIAVRLTVAILYPFAYIIALVFYFGFWREHQRKVLGNIKKRRVEIP